MKRVRGYAPFANNFEQKASSKHDNGYLTPGRVIILPIAIIFIVLFILVWALLSLPRRLNLPLGAIIGPDGSTQWRAPVLSEMTVEMTKKASQTMSIMRTRAYANTDGRNGTCWDITDRDFCRVVELSDFSDWMGSALCDNAGNKLPDGSWQTPWRTERVRVLYGSREDPELCFFGSLKEDSVLCTYAHGVGCDLHVQNGIPQGVFDLALFG
jgi:hypothetical protein